MVTLAEIRAILRRAAYADEDECVAQLLKAARSDGTNRAAVVRQAEDLVRRSRAEAPGSFYSFLAEFDLSNREGVALMCLAESLLRIPDQDTADALIAERVQEGDWHAHLSHSKSLFVNASAWGLLLTGKVVALDRSITADSSNWFRTLFGRLGEPVVRQAMLQAIRVMGNHYVMGRSIEQALKRGPKENPPGTLFSFDMLGEGARTDADARRYFAAYLHAIQAISHKTATQSGKNVFNNDGISIKLSALHPRYQQTQYERVMAELVPRAHALAVAARNANIGLNIDAEEASRLDLSLSIFEILARDPKLADWDGLGFVVQSYQKRAPFVIDWLSTLARETGRRFMVRLVKGAYWDTEVKHAQQLGLPDYPVFTRKANTDLSYEVCARKLLAAGDVIYPQFATHNALTIATVLQMAKPGQAFELQRLHGMGHLLYQQLLEQSSAQGLRLPQIRVYAPVGSHQDLLPYLVRRLLENGANSSFVHSFLDSDTSIERVTEDIIAQVQRARPYRHPRISKPPALYQSGETPRSNAPGLDIEDAGHAETLIHEINALRDSLYRAGPIINGVLEPSASNLATSPADARLIVGEVQLATEADVNAALAAAYAAQRGWDSLGGETRASLIEAVAQQLIAHTPELVGLISREAGRTLKDALAEVREAIDFCHYYAALARRHFSSATSLAGPTGERNELSLHGRGVFVCISPWNFPLAIFTGQVVAALAAGNTVVAKPAEQTPLVAARAVQLMHAAGVPSDVLNLVPGVGSDIGPLLINDPRTSGVAFTGSTQTARLINRQLAERDGPILPLIAETGGINALIADSSALPEQLVDDVITSAFLSAGQRCSAARVLFVQEEAAEKVLEMLKGACDELTLGLPWETSTDIGPVIDDTALSTLREHIQKMTHEAELLYAYPTEKVPESGTFLGPHIFQLQSLAQLDREVFGPILHVIHYRSDELDKVIDQINSCGYGLTLGVHSRIQGRAQRIFQNTRIGNTYVNRNMVGAVVGVNPFGGQGLSGTGPKAGGPLYLFRFATEKTLSINTTATGGNVDLFRAAGDYQDT